MNGTLGAVLLAQVGGDGGGGIGGMFMWLIELAIIVAVIVGWWKLFEKAGKQVGRRSFRFTISLCLWKSSGAQFGGLSFS